MEPWPYGGLDTTDENRRYFQGLIFAQDKRNGNPDSNFYAFPLPVIPIMDAHKQELIRIDRPATGGKGDPMTGITHKRAILDHLTNAEYVPELLPNGTRTDLKALNVQQPDGPSFSVTDESLVEWQKWRFRVSFNPREGAVVHDVHYDGRSVLYRLSISEMVTFLPSPGLIHVLTIHRLFRTLMHDRLFNESRHSTLVMEVLATVPTTYLSDGTVWVSLRYRRS